VLAGGKSGISLSSWIFAENQIERERERESGKYI
jgi:hypothetical protein